MFPYTTRFSKDIVTEFIPSARPSNKVIILAPGAPGTPGRGEILEFFAKKGFWAFKFRYRGTWESGGKFLQKDPTLDVLDIINSLDKSFKDFWNGKKFRVEAKKIFLIGHSFGGAAVLLLSKDPRVTKVIAVAPITDWKAPTKFESLEFLDKIQYPMFGEGYRFGKGKSWRMFHHGSFYNPIDQLEKIDGKKIFIFQAKDDDAINPNSVAYFAKKVGTKIKMYKTGGHLSTSILMKPLVYRQLAKFFNY